MKMTMALNCPIFTITATSMSSIMGRNPILKENSNFDILLWFTKYFILPSFELKRPGQSGIMGRNPILKENTNFDTLQLCAKKYRKFRF